MNYENGQTDQNDEVDWLKTVGERGAQQKDLDRRVHFAGQIISKRLAELGNEVDRQASPPQPAVEVFKQRYPQVFQFGDIDSYLSQPEIIATQQQQVLSQLQDIDASLSNYLTSIKLAGQNRREGRAGKAASSSPIGSKPSQQPDRLSRIQVTLAKLQAGMGSVKHQSTNKPDKK